VDAVLLAILRHSLKIGLIVPIAQKRALSLIAPTDDVVEQARRKHARTTGHEPGG
jgi:hypothetical protein